MYSKYSKAENKNFFLEKLIIIKLIKTKITTYVKLQNIYGIQICSDFFLSVIFVRCNIK